MRVGGPKRGLVRRDVVVLFGSGIFQDPFVVLSRAAGDMGSRPGSSQWANEEPPETVLPLFFLSIRSPRRDGITGRVGSRRLGGREVRRSTTGGRVGRFRSGAQQ